MPSISMSLCLCKCRVAREFNLSSVIPLYHFLQSADRIIKMEGNANTKTPIWSRFIAKNAFKIEKIYMNFPRFQLYIYTGIYVDIYAYGCYSPDCRPVIPLPFPPCYKIINCMFLLKIIGLPRPFIKWTLAGTPRVATYKRRCKTLCSWQKIYNTNIISDHCRLQCYILKFQMFLIFNGYLAKLFNIFTLFLWKCSKKHPTSKSSNCSVWKNKIQFINLHI